MAYLSNYRAYTRHLTAGSDAIEFAAPSGKLREKSMAIKQVKTVADVPSSELDDWGPVPQPVSEQISRLRGIIINENPDGSEAGIWECTPGTWTRLVMDAEISSFVSGHALFHPDDGETVDIKAGDTVYFDNNSKGTWEVLETVRKAYLTFKRE
jgi:uncharacterized cupin superfamily protein